MNRASMTTEQLRAMAERLLRDTLTAIPAGWTAEAILALATRFIAEHPANGHAPIDMVLPCPRCGRLHIDAPEPEPECNCRVPEYEGAGQHATTCSVFREVWTNPPHRSHKCHGCGLIWRPADVPTNGVAAVKTRGEKDSPDDGDERITGDGLMRLGLTGGPILYRHGVGNVAVKVWSADPRAHPQWRMNAFHGDWNNYVVVRTLADVLRVCAALGVTPTRRAA